MQMSCLTLLIRYDNKAIQTEISIRYQRQQADTKDNSPAAISKVHTTHICCRTFWHTCFEFLEARRRRMGEALIDLIHQYPALWDKQHTKYKDSNYKDARWGEIAEILSVPKYDAIKKWKSLWDTYVRQKSIKVKSGDSLSDSKPRWKYYTIMSFLDVSLLKRRYAPILLRTDFT